MTESLADTYLGQYHLTELIGRGGMASVYKANQETLGRFVAIKILSRQDDPEFANRFRAEARATAYLQHPHILPIYDYGEQNGLFYLVLQYVENSRTLDDLTGKPLPVAQSLLLMVRLLAALEYAHSRGIVHRDIKPANVLLPSPDWPLLTDFGIAKLLDETGQRLTATGLIVGTPAYIAPEQAMGKLVDARTDLYAVGVILYEMLTGELPFTADSAMALLLKHVNEPPPSPQSINPDLPAELESVLQRALAKRPDDRYATAREMADDLERLMVQVEPGYAMNRMANLYQNGVRAFESQHWAQAITHLSQLQTIAPGYKDSADLLVAAQTAQQRTQDSASTPSVRQSSPAITVELEAVGADRPQATGAPLSNVSSAPEPVPVPSPRSQRRPAVIVGLLLLVLLLGGIAAFALSRGNSETAGLTSGTEGAQATSAPATPPPATTVAPTDPPAAATAATDGAAVAPVVPTGPTLGATGSLVWGDAVLQSDAVTVTVDALPAPPDGQVYAVWLSSDERSLILGTLNGGESHTLTYVSPTHENLIAAFDRVYITRVPESVATTEVANVIMVGTLPPQALVHVRHVLVSFDTTPNKIGFGIGLVREAEEVVAHIRLLQAAMEAGNLDGERIHAEHLVNIIEGEQGENFGDLNGDGKPQNPGDGFGLLQNGSQNGYLEGARAHAVLGAEAPDGTEEMKRFAAALEATTVTVRERLTTIRDLALKINGAPNAAATRDDVLAIAKLAQEALNGLDANGDGRIDPIPGEGGALVAYQQAHLMATVSLQPGTVLEAAAPAPAPTASTEGITVNVEDNIFDAKKLTIVVGSTVVWNNAGPSAHTVSAEDKSFESGTISNDGTFSHTFTEPGTYPYFCQFHGGPHGEGMSGHVIVNARP